MTELLDVFGLDASDIYVRTVALALPVAVLLTLGVLLAMKARKKKAKARALQELAAVGASSEPQALVSQAAAAGAAAPSVSIAFPPQPAAVPVREAVAVRGADAAPAIAKLESPEAATPVAEAPHPQTTLASQSADEAQSIESAKSQLNEKLSSAPKTSLAPLYLELARLCRAAGDEAACLAALRSAAGFGAQHGPRAAHAEARIELAEAAYSSGDLHGACEQWQIARMALHEDGQKEAYARVDKRMLQHGCPTDWVLTDF